MGGNVSQLKKYTECAANGASCRGGLSQRAAVWREHLAQGLEAISADAR